MQLILVLSVVCWVMTLVFLCYGWRTTRYELAILHADARSLSETVTTLRSQLRTIHQAVIPLNLAIQNVLVKELTHFHTPVLDGLMAKLGPPFMLTDEEEAELLRLLTERERDMGESISPAERDAAKILPVIIRRVRRDLAHITPATALALQMGSIMPTASDGKEAS